MITNRHARWLSILTLTGCLGTLVGCSVTRKSATMDSTSRMPFLNMELAPKRKEPAPETQRIRWDHLTSKDEEPAQLIANAPTGDSKTWWQRITGTEKKGTAVPLPRTDLVEPVPVAQPVITLPTNDVSAEF
jgi:hypothetical protein